MEGETSRPNEYEDEGSTLRGATETPSGLEVRVNGEHVEVLEIELRELGERERMERAGEKAVLRRRREWVGAKRFGRWESVNMLIDVDVE